MNASLNQLTTLRFGEGHICSSAERIAADKGETARFLRRWKVVFHKQVSVILVGLATSMMPGMSKIGFAFHKGFGYPNPESAPLPPRPRGPPPHQLQGCSVAFPKDVA